MIKKDFWLPVFFGIAACSWMPHWSCHYYRLETGSSFVVGSFHFSNFDSLLSMFLYSILIVLNLLAISFTPVRFLSALSSGILHLTLSFIHIWRLFDPFKFEVFGYSWSYASSVREIAVVLPFGILCIVISILLKATANRKVKSFIEVS